jgi:uncharacterized protein (DUF4415 family)
MISIFNQAAYAHTFTGEESASFLSTLRAIQAETNLVQSNLASNLTLAQSHAKDVVDIANGNHTFGVLPDEVSENNKRVSADITKGVNDLQTTVNSKPPPTPADVKPKLDYVNATLQEAITVRLPKEHLSNFMVSGEATKNLVNETLRQYGLAYGISGGTGSVGNTTSNKTTTASGPSTTITNMSAYQSAQALVSQSQTMLNQAKTHAPTNQTSTMTSAISKVTNDLSQLKNSIDTKSPYDKVASLVQNTIYPDLNAAFNLK